jgi:Ca2+-binding RTX toxin-like protein
MTSTNFEYGSNGDIATANTGIFDAPMGGQLSSINDIDVFKFEVTDSALLGISFKLPLGANEYSYTITILDVAGNPIFSNAAGADFSNISFSVGIGTYYFEIKANNEFVEDESNLQYFTTDPYEFTVKSLPAIEVQGEDYSQNNNFLVTASDIILGKGTPLVDPIKSSAVLGNLTSVSDVDYFKFVTTETGVFEFTFKAPTNVEPDEVITDPADPEFDPPGTIKEFFKISVLDSAENVLVTHYVSGTPDEGFNFDFSTSAQLNPSGIYYVKIENGGSVNNINTQQYTFDINPVEPSAENSAAVIGGALVDYLSGGLASDIIKGNAGNDVISGMAGNDSLDGGLGADVMKGGLGNDTYVVGIATDLVIENSNQGVDKVTSSVNYTLTANVENLVLSTTTSATGTTTGATTGKGNALDNIIVGNSFANTLTGLAGNDTLDGGLGLKGDVLVGGTGDDTYYINNKLDKITESAGASNGYDTALAKVDVMALAANVEELILMESGSNADGSSLATYGVGNTLANFIQGNSASNQLSGLAGDDFLRGGGGNDALIGGLGSDTLWGGTGSDLFVFEKALSATTNVDLIADFESGIDAIQLSKLIFSKLVGPAGNDYMGELSIDNFHIGDVAADANDFIIYDSTTGDLFYDANGSTAGSQVLFAKLGADTELAYTDFIVL